jgi:hypothetical protein
MFRESPEGAQGTRGGTIVSLTLPDGKKLGKAGQTNNPLGPD